MNPIEYIDRAVSQHPERTAIIDGDRRYTYRQLHDYSHRISWALTNADIRPGDRVAAYTPNDATVLLLVCGVVRSGAVWAPISSRRTDEENIAYLRHIGAKVLFYNTALAGSLPGIRQAVPSLKICVSIDGPEDVPDALARWARDRGDRPDAVQDTSATDSVTAVFQTSGTTGTPKAVEWHARGFSASFDIVHRYCSCNEVVPVCLNVASLAHGALIFAFAILAEGGTHVMASFMPRDILRAIARHRVTHLLLPPMAVTALLEHPETEITDLSSLRCLLVGMGALSVRDMRRASAVFGKALSTWYGQIEAGAIAWFDGRAIENAVRSHDDERLQSCGRAVDTIQIATMDDGGALLPPGVAGEVVVKGVTIASYWDDPESVANVRNGQWHRTGDIGRIDEDGLVYLLDRKRDLIKTGGHTVFSAEVENCIRAIPGVADCAVISVPNAILGEVIKAVVVPSDADLTDDVVIAECTKILGSLKSPRLVEFAAQLPRTVMGKVNKCALRDL